jgi:cardiolipin synthase
MDSTFFLVLAIIAILLQGLSIYLFFFEPALSYRIIKQPKVPSDSNAFLRVLEAIGDAQLIEGNRIEVLTNGEAYYEAELEAIRGAYHSISLEAYIFQKGRVTSRFVEALTERARAGVKVRVVLDAIGCFLTPERYFRDLRAAGGQVCWYHPIRLHNFSRINNRTHREIIVVDGRIGFIGGSGFADHWLYPVRKHPPWRDTMVRVDGPVVRSLQSTFSENWLEASGEIMMCLECFPNIEPAGDVTAMVVDSSASAGKGTRARMVYQTLISAASESVYITTPYFLPDAGLRKELIRAVRERGVKIQVITTGRKSDHILTRRSSRRLYGELLKSGIQIYEYHAAMNHTKSMVIDGRWSVVGSTNFDNRSFELNDEANLVALNPPVALRLYKDFASDLEIGEEITYEGWKKRPIFERILESFGWVLERQQ